MPGTVWEDDLARFHAERPGITERALAHALDREAGTAYDRLLEPLPPDLGHVLDVASVSSRRFPFPLRTAGGAPGAAPAARRATAPTVSSARWTAPRSPVTLRARSRHGGSGT